MKSAVLFAAALLGAGMSAAPVMAQVEVKPDVYPDWKRKPTASQLQAVWPHEAAKKQQTGKALISCKVNALGALYDCSVVSESPAGAGFGEAAIALTPQFLMTPAMKDGQVVPYVVRIPINFSVPPPPPRPQDFSPKRVATDIKWLAAPTYDEMAAAYPVKAREAKLGGAASLTCTLTKEGRVKACSTLLENPRDLGFAAAAKTLAPLFVGPTTWADGKSIAGGRVDIAFSFSPSMLGDGPRLVAKPQWLRVPTADQLVGSFPGGKQPTTAVRVALDCLVQAGGKLNDCKVQSEQPAGEGFGVAAVNMSQYFQVTSWSVDGLPTVGGRIRVPIRYEIAPAKP